MTHLRLHQNTYSVYSEPGAGHSAYWRLLKKIEDDPRYDKRKAEYLLKSFVELHPQAIREKARIMVEHFAAQVQNEIGCKYIPHLLGVLAAIVGIVREHGATR